MATFTVQVSDLTGFGSTDDVALASWLADGCKEIINVMPKDELVTVCLEEEDVVPSTGLNVRTPIIGVTRATATSNGNTYQCREISMLERYESQDEDSILYATETDPVYYLESQTSGINKVKILPVSTSALGKVTKVVYPTPSVGASTINSFPDKYENLVVLYTSVKALQRLMNDKSSSLPTDVSSIVLTQVSTSLPSFTTPSSFILPVSPSDVDVSFTNVGTISPFISPSFSSTAPTYTGPVVAPDFSDANTWLNTEEDSEMVSSRIAIIKAQLQEYQMDIQNATNKFNESNIEYQADLTKYTTDIQKETSRVASSIQDFQAEVGKAVQTYQAETGYDMSKYKEEVQANVQQFQNNLSKNTADFTNNLQKYTSEAQKVAQDNQNTLAQYSQDIANYGAKIQKHSTDYQWYQSQYTQLKADYQQGLQLLIGGGQPPPQRQPQQQARG